MRPYPLTPRSPRLPRIERKELIITDWDQASYPMRLHGVLKQILIATRHIWDVPDVRKSVRENFRKVLECGTAALGAEIFASDFEEMLLMHRCKSRACSSCGHRATASWQRDRWCVLFDAPYSMVTLTMPDVLWTIFRDNRHLLYDLPAIGAKVLSRWALLRYGVSLDIDVIQHTFGRHLNFNCHLHVLVSGIGFRRLRNAFILVKFNSDELMRLWRDAVILYLKEITKTQLVKSYLPTNALIAGLTLQGRRPWRVHIARFRSKEHLLRYAGRYVRRPPIAQHRFLRITDEYVDFWTHDRVLKRRVLTRYRIDDFVLTLAEHIPDHYRHSVRSFGLLAPRSIAITRNSLFLFLGQRRRERPIHLKYRDSIRRSFGRDPLLDSKGNVLKRIGRLQPQITVANHPA